MSPNDAVEMPSTHINAETSPSDEHATGGGGAPTTTAATHANKYQTAFNIFGITCFPLALPFAFGQTGFAAGIPIYALVVSASYLNAWLLGDICVRVRLGSRHATYPLIAEAAFGWRGSALVNTLQSLNFFLLSVYGLVLIASSLSLTGKALCQDGWIGAMAAMLVPFAQIPSFEELSALGIVYVAVTLVALVILIQQSATEGICDGRDRSFDSVTPLSIITGMTAMGFSFSGSGVFPELMAEMADKSEYLGATGSLSLSWYIIVPVNLLAGIVGFAAFGNKVSGTVMLDYPSSPMRTVSAACVAFLFSFALLESNQVLAPKVEKHLGIHPTAMLSAGAPPAGSMESGKRGNAFERLPPALARGIIRTLLIAAQAGVALGIYNIGAGYVSVLCGALGGIPLSFVIPIACHMKLLPERTTAGIKKLLVACAALFLAVAAVGVYLGIAGLMAGSGSGGGCAATTDAFGRTTANHREGADRCGW